MSGCFQCDNCKTSSRTYFCPEKNDFMLKTDEVSEINKGRSGWKKGNPNYEGMRRKYRQIEG